MKTIQTKNGQEIKVDDEDYVFLNQWKWKIHKSGYAVRNSSIDGKRITISMHRLITNCPNDLQVDHINGDKLDNRKANLRNCTASQNSKNIRINSANTTGLKGVRKLNGKYQAVITVDYKRINLGRYVTKEQAKVAYDQAAILLHGEFANVG